MAKTNLDISIVVPGLPIDPGTLASKSLGGSETAGIYMARGLARRGHTATIFCNTPQAGKDADGLIWMPLPAAQQALATNPHDVCIVQRWTDTYRQPVSARLKYLWCHDLAMGRQAPMVHGVAWNFDKIMTVSRYHGDQYKQAYCWPESHLYVTRNGIDVDAVRAAKKSAGPRRPKTLMYASRPERGLDVFLERIFPKILEKEPDTVLWLAGYDNKADQLAQFYGKIDALIAQFGKAVEFKGFLPKEKLYELYWQATAYVYPTPSPIMADFREVSCISAMEAQVCGLPFISTRTGALPETLAEGAGVLIDKDPITQASEYDAAFTEAVLSVVNRGGAWEAMSEKGKAQIGKLSWEPVAREWEEEFFSEFEKRTANKITLARHFIRTSDIVAAKEAIGQAGNINGAIDVRDWIDENYGFLETPEKFAEQYEKIGHTTTDVFAQSGNEPRLKLAIDWMNAHPEIENVLDYGCAHGGYAVHLHNATGKAVTGIDVSPKVIEWANQTADKHAKDREKLRFVSTTSEHLKDIPFKYDSAMIFEVLEHVPEPWKIVDDVEASVKDGGKVIITVPYGPWEYASHASYPHRCHCWEFDLHDLRDMFGGKRDIKMTCIPSGMDPKMERPIGWYFAEWTVDKDRKTSRVDMVRKLAIQAPRQSLGLLVMAGPNSEETLGWALQPWKDNGLADELVIADCGISELAAPLIEDYVNTARKYCPLTVTVIQHPGPVKTGFETPLNAALERVTCDWVFRVDTDERLTNPAKVHRNLRECIFDGYGIPQVHMATDANFDPDMPCRLFRTRPRAADGKKMKFVGMIHEHPEYDVNEGPGTSIVLTDFKLAHVGYISEAQRQGRFVRNWPLLEMDIAKYPDRKLQKLFIIREWTTLVRHQAMQMGGAITPEHRAKLEEMLGLWRTHFKGLADAISLKALEFYSLAVTLLGRGIAATLSVNASPEGAFPPPGSPMVGRFDTQEDFEATLKALGQNVTQNFFTKGW